MNSTDLTITISAVTSFSETLEEIMLMTSGLNSYDELERLREVFDNADVKSLSIGNAERLMQSGAIATLSVARWRGMRKIQWSDFGIYLSKEDESRYNRTFKLGHKAIWESEILRKWKSLETRGRQAIERRSYDTPYGRFVPADSYESLKSEIDYLRNEYLALGERSAANYDNIVNGLQYTYRAWAKKIWLNLYNQGREDLPSLEEFQVRFWKSIADEVPTASEIVDSLEFKLSLSFVPALAGNPAMVAGLSEEAVSLQRDVMRQAAARKSEEIDQFLVGLQQQLYSTIVEAAEEVTANIRSSGRVHHKSVQRLRNLTQNLREMNFWEDERVEQVISTLEYLSEERSYYSPSRFLDILDGINEYAGQVALQESVSNLAEELDLQGEDFEEWAASDDDFDKLF
jgi:hypothetical protein